MKSIMIGAFSLLCGSMLLAEEGKSDNIPPDKTITYKTVTTEKGKFDLKLHVFSPAKPGEETPPCMVMIHGGGWNNGTPASYYKTGKLWSDMGMVAIAVEYRVRDLHGGTALDSVRDAKSAMRWIRFHAGELGIDPDRIAAQGSSAGGHLAAACATLTAFDEEGEDTAVSCRPNALILTSPVLDNGPGGYGQYKPEVRENWKEFSPFHNIRESMPPTLVSVGDAEAKYLRVEVAKALKEKLENLGSRCELIVLKGAEHGKRTAEQKRQVQQEEIGFLKSLGFIIHN